MIRLWLMQIAYPEYDCEDCTGTGAGCYCSYHNASAAGIGPTRLQRLALWLLR